MKRLLLPIFCLLIAAAAALRADRAPPREGAAPSTAPAADPAAAGRLLLNELNCTACHAASKLQGEWLSPKQSPRLGEIGSRASPEWITRYLAAPHETMPGTTMPDLLAALAPAQRAVAAESLTHFLLSQSGRPFQRAMPNRAAVARGENLYHSIGCIACHAPQRSEGHDAPSVPLPHMAEKWSFDGLRRFLLDPLASRPSGRMPAMRLTDGEASDLAHYLLRQTHVSAAVELATYQTRVHALDEIDTAELARTEPAAAVALDAATKDRRDPLRFSAWLRVDQAGAYTFYFSATGASRLSVDGSWVAGEESWETERVDAKVAKRLDAGWHEIKADYVYRGNRPAAMKLEWEGPGIAREAIPPARLRSERDASAEPAAFVVDPAKAAVGRSVYEKLNCAACHDGKPAAAFLPTLAALKLAALQDDRGCLADKPPPGAPDFHFAHDQADALRAALHSLKTPDLAAPTAEQRVANTMATFKCTACHARGGIGGVAAERDAYFVSSVADTGDEGRLPPRLDGVGDKLVPAWLDKVLSEGESVRPSLCVRMPRFGKENVGHLTELLVAIDRKPRALVASNDAAEVQKDAGRKMAGTDGLSCIVCHRFNRQAAQTFQAIDLTTTPARLNRDWFNRFLLDPNHFHPGTRMPAFWPDGKSLLPALLGGDIDRQHAALWTYLADGPQAKFPEGLSRQGVELVVGGEAVVYRGKLWEAGFRAVAVGYPGQLNAAFDAEEMRLALLWRGRFLNAGPHWQVQGMGEIHPLGTDVVIFPHGSPLAVLPDASTPWPAESSKALGMKFRGYQLDESQRPTWLYAFGAVGVEDCLTPFEPATKNGLRRVFQFTEPVPANIYLRLAVGNLVAAGDNTWRLNDALSLTVRGGGKPILRGKGKLQELIIPLQFHENPHQLEVDYAW